MNSIIEINELYKIYRTGSEDLPVLTNINARIERNSFLTITGPSGSGKSTLLNLISGLDFPTSGRIFVDGRRIDLLDENDLTVYRNSYVGLVFQFHYLLNDFTALENVMLPFYMSGNAKKTAEEKAEELLLEVGLKERLTHYPQELSGGERQRVAVARALINDPVLILADEPTGNLDERNSEIVENLLFELMEKHKKTLILVTHDNKLADRGSVKMRLEHGELHKV